MSIFFPTPVISVNICNVYVKNPAERFSQEKLTRILVERSFPEGKMGAFNTTKTMFTGPSSIIQPADNDNLG